MRKSEYNKKVMQDLADILGVSLTTAKKYCKELMMIEEEKMKKNAKWKIILASKSERRKNILKEKGFNFEIYVPHVEEKNISGEKYSDELVKECAKEKAKNAYEELSKNTPTEITYNINEDKDIIIVSCDTIVVNNDVIIGKPKDKDDAMKILKSLSGKTHKVVSALCIWKNGKYYTRCETSYITLIDIPDEEIEKYIDERKPYDKAGAYSVQDEKYIFANSIEGSSYNVVGFPIELFKQMLEELEN